MERVLDKRRMRRSRKQQLSTPFFSLFLYHCLSLSLSQGTPQSIVTINAVGNCVLGLGVFIGAESSGEMREGDGEANDKDACQKLLGKLFSIFLFLRFLFSFFLGGNQIVLKKINERVV